MATSVLVIGAGITGLATGVALQQQGFDVGVVEARRDVALGAGISLWPNALAALDEIGLGDQVRGAGGRVATGALRRAGGAWLRRPAPQRFTHALGEPLVVIRRATLTEILTGALAPGTVQYELTADKVDIGTSDVRVTFTDGSIREAAGLVGADGVDSVVARHLNGPLSRRYTGYTAWRAVAACPLDPDLSGETLGAGSQVGHVPLGSDHTYWFATQRAPQGQTSPDGELAHLKRRFSEWSEPIPTLLATTDPDQVLRNDLYDRAPARVWARGPAVIAGDAAHPMRPHLGQGGCQGLEDAAILAALAARGPDLGSAFSRFGAIRRPRVKKIVQEAELIGRLVNLRPSALSAAATRASVLMPEWVLTRHLASIAGRGAFTPVR